jgi:hypothetical protein
MNAITMSLIVLACAFGGALLGMLLRSRLPGHHVSSESKDTVKIGMGLVGTMTALMLSLLIASAKSSYDVKKDEITQMAAKVAFLDRVLANYGPDAHAQRAQLRQSVADAVDGIWSPPRVPAAASAANIATHGAEVLFDQIHQLKPASELQQSLKTRALDVTSDLSLSRWLLLGQSGSAISTPFLVVTILWLTMIFISFGLFAPPNATVVCTLLLCALSVSGALFLVLELDRPFSGVIRISSDSMRNALSSIGQ